MICMPKNFMSQRESAISESMITNKLSLTEYSLFIFSSR